VTDHDHDRQVAMYGECIACAARPPDRQVLSEPGPVPDFDGATYRRDRDHARLSGQLGRVADALADGRWWTLAALAARTGDPEASVSARIRDLRKGRFGGYTVLAESVGAGTWRYRLVTANTLPNPPTVPDPQDR
jgi:hypothetical protein